MNTKEEYVWTCDFCGKEFNTNDECDKHEAICLTTSLPKTTFESFFNKYIEKLLTWGLGSLMLGVPVIIYFLLTGYLWWGVIALAIFFLIIGYVTYSELVENITKSSGSTIQKIDALRQEKDRLLKVAQSSERLWKQTLLERTKGFPTLFSYIEYFDQLVDDGSVKYLQNKSHPALSSAEIVRLETKRRRIAEKEKKITDQIISYYELLEPSLVEYKNEEFGDIDEMLKEWSDDEKSDPVTFLVSKDEYRKLPTIERNQLALERYWKRPHSKWHIGIMYERYIGYLYEQKGYNVIYQGAKEGKADLGRDLIAYKGDEYIVIQCKYWNQFRSVFENAIFQFFGTVFQYKHSNKDKNVKGIFYTTTKVSEIARIFAKELKIELKENYKMDKSYPCIKCNISSDKSKIYHLPFDQQYDNVLVEPNKGEFFCATVKEAENSGFRRAYRWHSAKGE